METSEVYNILMKSIDEEIDIVIDNHFTQSCFESYVRGFHVYKTVWSPLIGEENLKCRHEQNDKEDEFATDVYRNDLEKETLVGHMPRNISKFVHNFLKLPNSKISCQVSGKRINRGAGFGLEVPVTYTFYGHEKAIKWIKSKIEQNCKFEESLKSRCLK